MLAREIGVDGLSRSVADRLYKQRSIAAHGRRLRLISPRPDEPAPDYNDREANVIGELGHLQDVLEPPSATGVEDPAFAAHFAGEPTIRAKWPVADGDGNPL